ncbi:uncharacterized protein LOC122663911 [Telopea speciosissima]|uniref:uncharacterized protein LOC122663911 n=1 Tax=Telopea speciosissima TaxID=54955 RepID=UPI001CC33D22|nr:uncharacterized protein LOC122663911 [Telopea speciosissima]
MMLHTSLHGFLHTSQYPTPLSVTTAVASLLCFIAIAIDTLRGFRQKKLWFPCKYFSLNAATIAVLGMATSPPVFLRSPMPSCGDQLEKLTSSILLCVSMGFFMPSLGSMNRTELIFNLVTITFLATTMVVNICFQIGTAGGLEFRYFLEHMIIIICIVALLAVLWFSLPEKGIKNVCDIMYLCAINEHKPSTFEEMRYSLKETSKVAYVGNPQYILGRSSNCILVSILCGISVTVLLQEIFFRSIMIRNSSFCNGVSEHGFSTWVIVAVQSIAIVTVAVATTTRWFVIAWHVGPERFATWRDIFRVEQYHLLWWRELENQQMLPPGNAFHLKILRGLKRIIFDMLVIAQIDILVIGKFMCYLSMSFTFMLKKLLDCLGYKLEDGHQMNNENTRWVHSISSFLGESDLNSWMLSNWERDMTRWERRCGRNTPTHLIELLYKWPPHSIHHFHNLSSPHLVLVMRIALLLSSNEEQNRFLLDAFNQGLQLVLFVEENSGDQSTIFNGLISPTLWRNRNNPDNWLNKKFECSGTGLGSINVMELGILLQMFRDYHEHRDEFDILNHLSEGMEMMLLVDIVAIAIFTSGLEDGDQLNAADFFEETACQILRSILSELPHAIYNEYSRYPFEKCDERIKRAMYFLYMSENLQDHVEFNWDERDDGFFSSNSYSPNFSATSSSSSDVWSFNPITE